MLSFSNRSQTSTDRQEHCSHLLPPIRKCWRMTCMPESAAPSAVPPAPRSAPRTARERVRRELTIEIKAVALAQLASSGGAALSLRAIAREMGMASSALFRYFRSRDALLTALIIDSYSSLAEAAETAEVRV